LRSYRRIHGALDGSGLTLAIVVSRFNEFVTGKLLAGAEEAAERCGVARHELFWVPGSFEIPVVAKRLAESGRYISSAWAVVRHETALQYVAGRPPRIQQAALDTASHIFGVLTCDTEGRPGASGGKRGNKGSRP
jgi:6,7-dimethyl-8-ribityllumazine synthase